MSFWTVLASCALVDGPATPVASCSECADSIEHAYCAANGQCVAFDGAGCDYGLVQGPNDCDDVALQQPTSLDVDCRLPANEGDPACARTDDLPPGSIGLGPNLEMLDLGGGFVDGDRLVVAFSCDLCATTQSGILAIDLRTGDRTLLSGLLDDPLQGVVQVGGGGLPTSYDDVQPAPDGSWVALDANTGGAEIDRIDPDSGDRTITYTQDQLDGWAQHPVCKLQGYGIAVGWDAPTSAQEGVANLVVAGDGTIFVRGSRSGTASEDLGLEGLVALRDGQCDVITAWSSERPLDLGAGSGADLESFYPWLVEQDGGLLAAPTENTLQRVDLGTGQRSVVSSVDPPLGTGPALGEDFAVLDAAGTTLFSSGPHTGGGTVVSVDLATGDRAEAVPLAGPLTWSDNGPMFRDPNRDGVLLMAVPGGLVGFDPASGNSNVLSR